MSLPWSSLTYMCLALQVHIQGSRDEGGGGEESQLIQKDSEGSRCDKPGLAVPQETLEWGHTDNSHLSRGLPIPHTSAYVVPSPFSARSCLYTVIPVSPSRSFFP
jgi:hypothetical protein